MPSAYWSGIRRLIIGASQAFAGRANDCNTRLLKSSLLHGQLCCSARKHPDGQGGADGASCRPEPLEVIDGLGATVFDNPECSLYKLTHHHVMFALHRVAYDVGVGDRFNGY